MGKSALLNVASVLLIPYWLAMPFFLVLLPKKWRKAYYYKLADIGFVSKAELDDQYAYEVEDRDVVYVFFAVWIAGIILLTLFITHVRQEELAAIADIFNRIKLFFLTSLL